MGADLYIQQTFQPNYDRWQPKLKNATTNRDFFPFKSSEYDLHQKEVTKYYNLCYSIGYFRDNYNSYGLFRQLNLSWWRDITPLVDNDGFLSSASIESMKSLVFNAALDISPAIKIALEQNDPAPSEQTYISRRLELLNFLDQALTLNVPILASL